jgi:hypothetical protein
METPGMCPVCGAAHTTCPGRIPTLYPPTDLEVIVADNSYTADRRLYTDADGNVVEADDPNRQTLLVAAGGSLPIEEATRYGLNVEQKAVSKAPQNKAVSGPEESKDAAAALEAELEAEGVEAGPVVEVEEEAPKRGKK